MVRLEIKSVPLANPPGPPKVPCFLEVFLLHKTTPKKHGTFGCLGRKNFLRSLSWLETQLNFGHGERIWIPSDHAQTDSSTPESFKTPLKTHQMTLRCIQKPIKTPPKDTTHPRLLTKPSLKVCDGGDDVSRELELRLCRSFFKNYMTDPWLYMLV